MINYTKALALCLLLTLLGLDLIAQNVISRPFIRTAVPDCVDAIYDPGGKGKYPDSCNVNVYLWNANSLVLSEIDLAKNDVFEVFYTEFGNKVTVFTQSSKKGSTHTAGKYKSRNIRIVFYSNNDNDSASGFKIDVGCNACKIGELKASRINSCQGDSITLSYSDGSSTKINWVVFDSVGSALAVFSNADTIIKIPANVKYKTVVAQGCKYSDLLVLDTKKPYIYASDSIFCGADTVQLAAGLGQSSSPRFEETFENFYQYYHDLHWDYSGGFARNYCGVNSGSGLLFLRSKTYCQTLYHQENSFKSRICRLQSAYYG